MNKVLKFLIGYDLFIISSFGLVQPVFGIYLKENVMGGSLATAGIAAAIFLVTKSISQPFIGKIADKERGNKREFNFLFLGSLLIIATPLIYIFAENIYLIYIAQFVYGLGSAFSFVAYYTLYTRFLSKGKEGYEWSIYDTFIGLSGGFTAFVGGFVAERFGFTIIFLMIAFFSSLSLVMLRMAKKSIF